VTEKRAPTDDSVKFLKEFEQKARDSVIAIGRGTIKNLDIDFKYCISTRADLFYAIEIKTLIIINGKEVRDSRTMEEYDFPESVENKIKIIYDMLYSNIAKELIFSDKTRHKLFQDLGGLK
jgi:hypothetical protein